MKRYIAFDLGASSGRCMVGELAQGVLSLVEVYRFTTPILAAKDALHWDIQAIFEELQTGLANAVQQCGPHFDGISVDTWGIDYVLLDESGALLGNPYHYRDARTEGMMEAAFATVAKAEIYQQTGIQFMPINTVFQLLAEAKQSPNLLEKAALLLPIPNYLLYLLSGVKKAEYTIVSTTQLADPRRRTWTGPLIEAFGFPQEIFPDVVEPGTILGPLKPELARQAGIAGPVPVIAGASHDTAAAVASVPALEAHWAYLSSGTWSLMGVELDAPLINEQTLARNYTNEGGIQGTTRFLKNIAGLWILQECQSYWEARGDIFTFAELADLAAALPPTHAWINPDEPRFLQPGSMPEKVQTFLHETNQSYRNDIGWITRCVLESLAFKYRLVFDELQMLTGQPINRLHIVGGGTQNTLLCQMTADAIHRDVVTGPIEGTVVGNVGTQAIATGILPDLDALRNVIAASFDLKHYTPQQTDYWDQNEATFRVLQKPHSDT